MFLRSKGMTVIEAIEILDKLRPNQYKVPQKLRWLSDLDGKIFEDVYLTHEDNKLESFEKYTEDDMTKELLIPEPYTEIYEHYLSAQIYYNNEMARYSNSMVMYNNELAEFEAWYNRKHKPVSKTRIINY